MRVKSVALYKFRNLKDQTVLLGPGVNLVFGLNGEGKSNFLEALYLVSNAASFRSNHLDELIQWGEKSASVFAEIHRHPEREHLKLGIILHEKSREAFVDGDKVGSLASYLGNFNTVCFSPGDLHLVKGSPSVRRKFLDRQIIHLEPQLTKHIIAFHKAVKNKAALLKSDTISGHELEPWDQLIAAEAYHVVAARHRCLRLLERQASMYLQRLAPSDQPLRLCLESHLLTAAGEPCSPAEILEMIRSKRAREIKQRAVLIGPHRDDIRISTGTIDARPYASQGQARSISISLKLATIAILERVRKVSPVVLLDDVESELDEERCSALYDLALEPGRQVVITGTASHAAIRNRVNDFELFRVSSGMISRE